MVQMLVSFSRVGNGSMLQLPTEKTLYISEIIHDLMTKGPYRYLLYYIFPSELLK